MNTRTTWGCSASSVKNVTTAQDTRQPVWRAACAGTLRGRQVGNLRLPGVARLPPRGGIRCAHQAPEGREPPRTAAARQRPDRVQEGPPRDARRRPTGIGLPSSALEHRTPRSVAAPSAGPSIPASGRWTRGAAGRHGRPTTGGAAGIARPRQPGASAWPVGNPVPPGFRSAAHRTPVRSLPLGLSITNSQLPSG